MTFSLVLRKRLSYQTTTTIFKFHTREKLISKRDDWLMKKEELVTEIT